MLTQERVYSAIEYLALEENAEVRNEFINGEIVPTAGGTTQHNELVTNLCLCLKPQMRKRGGKVYTENVKLRIPDFNIFTYPDVMITALWITVRDSRILSLPYLPFPSCPRWMSKTLYCWGNNLRRK